MHEYIQYLIASLVQGLYTYSHTSVEECSNHHYRMIMPYRDAVTQHKSLRVLIRSAVVLRLIVTAATRLDRFEADRGSIVLTEILRKYNWNTRYVTI